MMKSIVKKVTKNIVKVFKVLVLMFFLFVFGTTTTQAAESVYDEDISEEDYNNINYALNYMGYDKDDVLYYTDLRDVSVEADGSKNVVIIYDNEKTIGQYVKEKQNGREVECFIIGDGNTIIEQLIKEETDNLFEIKEQVIEEAAALDGAKNEGWETITKSAAGYLTNTAPVGSFIDVGLVQNDINPETRAGLCWAACGASIINYYTGNSYSALDVYNRVKLATGVNPVGNTSYQMAMYGLFSLKYEYVSRRLKFDDVISNLKVGSVVKYGVSRNGGAHAIVLCGAFRISTSYGFIYMDPNVGGAYVINYNDADVANTTTGDFYYYNGQLLYNRVINAFYNFKK